MSKSTFAAMCVAATVSASGTLSAPWAISQKYDPTAKKAIITITAKDNTWIGIGFGHGMPVGTDMIQCSVKVAAGTCFDMVSVGEMAPKADTKQNITAFFKAGATAGTTDITIMRDLDTQDTQDFVIPLDTEFNMSWSLNDMTNNIGVKHTMDGDNTYMTFKSDGS